MTDLENFLNSKSAKKDEGDFQEATGTYPCQYCDENVYESKYYTDKAELVWYCSKGHRSFVHV